MAEEGKKLEVICKSGEHTWNNLTQKKASDLCQQMYSNKKTFESDLTNGFAYDTALIFLNIFGNFENLDMYGCGTSNGRKDQIVVCNVNGFGHTGLEYSTETCNYGHLDYVLDLEYYITIRGYYPPSTANYSYGCDLEVFSRSGETPFTVVGPDIDGYIVDLEPKCFRPIIYFS